MTHNRRPAIRGEDGKLLPAYCSVSEEWTFEFGTVGQAGAVLVGGEVAGADQEEEGAEGEDGDDEEHADGEVRAVHGLGADDFQ